MTQARSGDLGINVAAVHESVAESTETSNHHRAQELEHSTATLHRILNKNLHFHAHKM